MAGRSESEFGIDLAQLDQRHAQAVAVLRDATGSRVHWLVAVGRVSDTDRGPCMRMELLTGGAGESEAERPAFLRLLRDEVDRREKEERR